MLPKLTVRRQAQLPLALVSPVPGRNAQSEFRATVCFSGFALGKQGVLPCRGCHRRPPCQLYSFFYPLENQKKSMPQNYLLHSTRETFTGNSWLISKPRIRVFFPECMYPLENGREEPSSNLTSSFQTAFSLQPQDSVSKTHGKITARPLQTELRCLHTFS